VDRRAGRCGATGGEGVGGDGGRITDARRNPQRRQLAMSSCMQTPAHSAWSSFSGAILARFPAVALITILCIAAQVSGCSRLLSKDYDIRYRVNITIETTERKYTGTGVYRVTYRLAKRDNKDRIVRTIKKGEAVTIDLGQRGIVFALVISEEDFSPTGVGPLLFFGKALGSMDATDLDAIKQGSLHANIPRERLPMLVKFVDVADRDSLVRVLPNVPVETLGDGVLSISATIETTDDPVTEGLAEMLPWVVPVSNHPKDHGPKVMPSADIPVVKMTRMPTDIERLKIYDFRWGFE
jgi:hypothetical protein